MKGYLLDINVLLALAWPNHIHHSLALEWFRLHSAQGWATCSVTQLGFIRLSAHPSFTTAARSPMEARNLLTQICDLPHHQFWSDPGQGLISASVGVVFRKILTHGHVTDGYLVAIAANQGGKVATLDQALCRTFPEHTEIVRS